MKATVAFMFFMLFLAGIALVNLQGMQDKDDATVTSIDQLTDMAWRPTHIGEMALDDDTQMFLQFNADGQAIGHAGCNRFFGSFELVETKLRFGPIGSTRMSCPEPAGSFEISFLEALDATQSAARVDSRLALRNEDGQSVLRFTSIDRVDP